MWLLVTLLALALQGQGGNIDARRGREMLQQLRAALSELYYDPTFGGVDLKTRFAVAEERLKTAKSSSDILSALALPLMDLEDSHTFFVPPVRAVQVDYGWTMGVVGDGVYVTSVRPGTEAARQVTPGDRVLRVNTLVPTRETLDKIRYVLGMLRPQPGLVVQIRKPDGTEKEVKIRAETRELKRVLDLTSEADWHLITRDEERSRRALRNRDHAIGKDILIWKMAVFSPDRGDIDGMVRKAHDYKALILDLRGNAGGAVIGLERLASSFFDKEVPIATVVGRKERTTQTAKPVRQPFTGPLIVLTDASSGSAAEMFARLVQIHGRGTVVGDRTAGAVMLSNFVPLGAGMSSILIYGMSVTIADVLMPDGSRLERRGVSPDVMLTPTPEDMAAGRDPVLAKAVALAGGSITAEEAGKLFPLEWTQ